MSCCGNCQTIDDIPRINVYEEHFYVIYRNLMMI